MSFRSAFSTSVDTQPVSYRSASSNVCDSSLCCLKDDSPICWNCVQIAIGTNKPNCATLTLSSNLAASIISTVSAPLRLAVPVRGVPVAVRGVRGVLTPPVLPFARNDAAICRD